MASITTCPADTPRAAATRSDPRHLRPTVPSEHPGTAALASVCADVASHQGLRIALRSVEATGWDGPAGRAVIEAIQQRAGAWAFLADRRCGRPTGSTDPADVVAVAWLTLVRFGPRIADSQHPWAYLWTAVGNELARAAVAESQLRDPERIRSTSAAPTAVVRVGLEPARLDAAPPARPETMGEAPHSPAVTEIAHRLAERPSDVGFWLDAIERALDVMADARRSYEEHMLRRDPYLRETVGLTPDELSALGALLIGPRKGDRAAQSLLLALHRDAAVPTGAVVGAAARVDVLREARRRATAGRSAA